MRRVEEVGAGVVEHSAPAWRGRGNAEAEKAKRGFGEDSASHADGGLNDEGLQRVGKDVVGQEAEVRCAQRPRSFYELAFPDGEHLSSHEASVVDPTGDGQRKDDIAKTAAEEGDKGDGKQDARKGEKGVGHVDVEDDVGHAAVEAGDGANDSAEQEREADDGNGDKERDASAEEETGEDVTAELVSAEEVRAAREGESLVEVEHGRVVGCEPRRKDGRDGEAEKERQAKECEGVSPGVG